MGQEHSIAVATCLANDFSLNMPERVLLSNLILRNLMCMLRNDTNRFYFLALSDSQVAVYDCGCMMITSHQHR